MNLSVKNYILSIIVTAHNCENYLEKCLQSLLESTGNLFSACQVILIDDASADRTSEICEYFSHTHANVNYYQVNFTNIGKVRNFALEKCTGEYITMIDGDDEVIPEAFADICTLLTREKPDILLTRLNEIYPDTVLNDSWQGVKYSRLTRHKAIIKFLTHKDIQSHFIGQFIRRDIFDGLRFPEFFCYEDMYLFPSVLVKCNTILYLSNGPYYYFKRSNSLSSNITPEKISLSIKAIEQMHIAFGKQYDNLIACHWVNIMSKHKRDIKNEYDNICILKHIHKISFSSFLLDSKVRVSFKRKYINILMSCIK